jgi:hypothetical protein
MHNAPSQPAALLPPQGQQTLTTKEDKLTVSFLPFLIGSKPAVPQALPMPQHITPHLTPPHLECYSMEIVLRQVTAIKRYPFSYSFS